MEQDHPRVLLVEDDPDQAVLMQRWLAFGLRAEVRGCVDSGPAVDALRHERFDVVVIDVELPSGSGLDLAARIREHNRRIPILVITAHGKLEYAVEAIRSGVNDFAVKPIARDDLVGKVRRLLSNARTSIEPRSRVLAIGAHPDDVEIGIGGILLRHREAGDEVVVLTLSGGEAGGVNSVRAKEAARAARLLGATLELRSLPDTRIGEGTETISEISEVIKKYRPDTVYTHSSNDVHQDHRNAHRATIVAARGLANVLCYQSPSATTAFCPTMYVDVEHVLAKKLEVIGAYASQTTKCAYLEPGLISSTARYWSRFSHATYVEPLEVVRCASYKLAATDVEPVSVLPRSLSEQASAS